MVLDRSAVAVDSMPADPCLVDTLRRVRAEFVEMPGLKLTLSQAARLWSMDLATCAAVLAALVDARFLVVRRDAYMRA